MSRGIGELEPIQELVPEWLAVVVALLTQLGDIWFLAFVLAAFYWFDAPRRDNIATVAGAWLAGMGMYKGLKEIFGFPRPNEPLLDPELLPKLIQPLYEATAMATGYGFPSGHAVNTTIVYFGLAYVLTVSTARRRFASAAAIVTTVCFTRLALGVHYLVDVVVGVAVGLALLLAARALINRRLSDPATITFGLAVLFGVFFVVTSEIDADAIFILGASLGAFAGWQLIMLGRELVAVSRPSRALRPIAVRGGFASLALASLLATYEYFPLLSAYTAGGTIGLTTAVIVTIPVMRHSEYARRVGGAISFWIRMGLLGIRYLLTPSTWRRAYAGLRHHSQRLLEWIRTR
ncbi:phosphatase PAP2 family protein [Halostagnicola sp. A-GB9-2]|uniref:phosphatase PAP2 family protein n=1 Tax=Halostagnicola sp. A-GB9-2 TaxID=3048066 RepID=UPI0024BF8DF6|nr:phosphatase PAP2 family protein [Halostagnicola sp. A-GB9-2]MDJ1431338.1 phosphatase PAP2 family protein [Halostagnicola sp. A-GB9-2]